MLRRKSETNSKAAAAAAVDYNGGATTGMAREMVIAVGVRRDYTVVSAEDCETVSISVFLFMLLMLLLLW